MTFWKVGTQNAITTSLDGSITDSVTTIDLTSTVGLQYPGIIVVDRVDANGVATPTSREYMTELMQTGLLLQSQENIFLTQEYLVILSLDVTGG